MIKQTIELYHFAFYNNHLFRFDSKNTELSIDVSYRQGMEKCQTKKSN